MNKRNPAWSHRILSTALLGVSPLAMAATTTVTDNFSGATTAYKWVLPNSSDGQPNVACLTAGSGSDMPRCTRLNDPPGKGALRLSDADNHVHGAIVSDFKFPNDAGLQVTFTTYTYGGSRADGITFFLADGDAAPSVGGTGGSIGYQCNNVNPGYNGVIGGYVGLGIDEFGNFLNGSTWTKDNNGKDVFNTNDNTNSGPGFRRGRIGLRGAGNVNWYFLNKTYPTQYPSGTTPDNMKLAVQKTCATGFVMDKAKNWAQPLSQKITVPDYPAFKDAGGKYTGFLNLDNNTQPIDNQTNECSNGATGCSRDRATPITYRLKITPKGILTFKMRYNGGAEQLVLGDFDIIKGNGGVPLPATFRFGFAGATGGQTNIHEITCFNAAPAEGSISSTQVNLPTGQIKTSAQVFLGSYNPEYWTGKFAATNLSVDPITQQIGFGLLPNWDASCVLTGGDCASTEVKNMTAQAPSSRVILTRNGTTGSGVSLAWNSLDNAQQIALSDDAAKTNGEKRLNYLRGDRSNEDSIFRIRNSILGDIINSGPAWVGPPSALYPTSVLALNALWSDGLYPAASPAENAKPYSAFQTEKATRQNMAYVGANDGLLHGFRSGFYDASGNYVGGDTSKPNDGKELLAYMPDAVLRTIHSATPALDYSSKQYAHAYSVDATPASGDLFVNGQWKTWLMGGLGQGGQAIYALDVTDPSNFSTGNAASIVKGEWSYNSSDPVWKNLGKTYGVPVIRRFHNGQWGAIFGNGWCYTTENSAGTTYPFTDASCKVSTGEGGIYVMTLSAAGVPSFKFLGTGVGTVSKPNGIAYVSSADLDDDHITDYAYAGDLYGNVWRFDLTSPNPDSWKASATPLFSTGGQPITTRITVTQSQKSTEDSPRLMLNFGTGMQTPLTIDVTQGYSKTTQSLYGIWDWNLSTWNSLSRKQYMVGTADPAPGKLAKANLKMQTMNVSTDGKSRDIPYNAVCWAGVAGCASSNHYGWYSDLSVTTIDTRSLYEQVIYSPTVVDGAFVVTTTIPAIDDPRICDSTSATGWTIAVDPASGTGFDKFFVLPGSGSGSSSSSSSGSSSSGGSSGSSSSGGMGSNVLTTAAIKTNSSSDTTFVRVSVGGVVKTGALSKTANGKSGFNQSLGSLTGRRINWLQRR